MAGSGIFVLRGAHERNGTTCVKGSLPCGVCAGGSSCGREDAGEGAALGFQPADHGGRRAAAAGVPGVERKQREGFLLFAWFMILRFSLRWAMGYFQMLILVRSRNLGGNSFSVDQR